MKHKTEFITMLEQLIKFIKNQFKSNVKFVRIDNAKELCQGPMARLYHEHGIIHQKSCTETPKQYSVVERKQTPHRNDFASPI